MKKDSLKSVIVITVICLVVAALLALTNSITAPMIAKANEAAEKEALFGVLPNATDFTRLTVEDLPETVTAIYRETEGEGYAAMLRIKGYDSSNPMTVAVGILPDGTLCNIVVVSCTGETSGIGTKVSGEDFLKQFEGKTGALEGVDAISGATISSSAFIRAVRDAFTAYDIVKEVAA